MKPLTWRYVLTIGIAATLADVAGLVESILVASHPGWFGAGGGYVTVLEACIVLGAGWFIVNRGIGGLGTAAVSGPMIMVVSLIVGTLVRSVSVRTPVGISFTEMKQPIMASAVVAAFIAPFTTLLSFTGGWIASASRQTKPITQTVLEARARGVGQALLGAVSLGGGGWAAYLAFVEPPSLSVEPWFLEPVAVLILATCALGLGIAAGRKGIVGVLVSLPVVLCLGTILLFFALGGSR
jgi:hypothetical protein